MVNNIDFGYAPALTSGELLRTSEGSSFIGYELGSTNTDNTQPEVSVTELADNFFAQFTGYKGSFNAGETPNQFVNGEIITAAASWVNATNSINGVAGTTLDLDEILDLDLFTSNPEGDTSLSPNAQAEAVFLKFDGISTLEDLIVILKLIDPSTNTTTTKAILVGNNDIFKGPGTGPSGYEAITLGNNDGLVIIERNDYNFTGENWLIQGMQILNSEGGTSGTGINLNGMTGSTGGSTTTALFNSDMNGNPITITEIGFITPSSVGAGGGTTTVDPGTATGGGTTTVDPGTATGGETTTVDPGTATGGGTTTVDPGTATGGGTTTVDPGTATGDGTTTVDPVTATGGDSTATVDPVTATGGDSTATVDPVTATGGDLTATVDPVTATGGDLTATASVSTDVGGDLSTSSLVDSSLLADSSSSLLIDSTVHLG